MAFIDELSIEITAGRGGEGVVRWLRQRGRPKGGPAGGNGGRGADVRAIGVRDLAYLSNYRFVKDLKAEDGGPGGKNSLHGKDGEDLMLKFPVGTTLTNTKTGQSFEILDQTEAVKILSGGAGGYGNEHFKSSTNQNPFQSTEGKAGESAVFNIELKLIADIGLVGLPNAGKSSLLNAVTNAKSQVANYPFTTLEPHLGDYYGYIIADIPGLITGASGGKGLGHKFLRHIARTKMLFHLVSAEEEYPLDVYEQIRTELAKYSTDISEKREIILLSKADIVSKSMLESKIKDLKKTGKEVLAVSVIDEDILKAFTVKLSSLLKETS